MNPSPSRRASSRPCLDDHAAQQEFAEACGAPGGWTVEVWEPEEKGRFRLSHQVAVNRPWLVLGRSRRCDVPLRQPTISARHAYVQAWSGRALCFDLDSRSGTQRDVLLPSSGSGPGAAELAIGRYGARILANSTGHSTGETAPGISREPSPFWLEFLTRMSTGAPAREEQPQIYRPSRAVTLIGRSPTCRIQLQSRSISRIHCSLVQTASGVWIVDLLSRTGVRVNGRLVEFARLNDGDHLQIGRFEMNCLTESSVEGSMSTAHIPPDPQPKPTAGTAPDQSMTVASPFATASGMTVYPQLLPATKFGSVSDAGLSSEFVNTLARELAAVQQQMFHQSQQVLASMTEMISSLHHSQMQVLHTELEQVRQLSRELVVLRAETALVPAAESAEPATSRVQATGTPPPADVNSVSGNQHANSETLDSEPIQPPPSASPPSACPAGPTADVEDDDPAGCHSIEAAQPQTTQPPAPMPLQSPSSGSDSVSSSSPHQAASKRSAAPPQCPAESTASHTTAPKPPSAPAPESERTKDGNREIHLWLHERMASVDRERQTRWQRILSLLNVGSQDHAYHKADVPE